ncbi:hypothetical protein WJX81_004281 [Elliptochloris bilobata]|uniref:Histone deacetylase domain-containing protein n=1 Tax=Elliptochloris bilobata TaxID=381761 RepID=A0AAW1QVQ3_9CHLO
MAGFRGRQASTLGVPIVYHEAYSAPELPVGHRFPMGVFRCIYDTLIREGKVSASQVHRPQVPALELQAALELVHDAHYLQRFQSGTLSAAEERRIGFGEAVRSAKLIERTLAEVAGTLVTAELALKHGLACNTAGGTHHAHHAAGSGFCVVNDLAVAAAALLQAGRVKRILILDLDVHQGDGTACIFQGQPEVYTCSVHAAANFPARKATSSRDIALPDGTGDDAYLQVLGGLLPEVLRDAQPDLVMYDAGVDVHADDVLGRLALSDDGIRRRELMVLDSVLAANIPLAGFVGGGAARAIFEAPLSIL